MGTILTSSPSRRKSQWVTTVTAAHPTLCHCGHRAHTSHPCSEEGGLTLGCNARQEIFCHSTDAWQASLSPQSLKRRVLQGLETGQTITETLHLTRLPLGRQHAKQKHACLQVLCYSPLLVTHKLLLRCKVKNGKVLKSGQADLEVSNHHKDYKATWIYGACPYLAGVPLWTSMAALGWAHTSSVHRETLQFHEAGKWALILGSKPATSHFVGPRMRVSVHYVMRVQLGHTSFYSAWLDFFDADIHLQFLTQFLTLFCEVFLIFPGSIHHFLIYVPRIL